MPAFPGTPDQLVRRREAMRHLIATVEEARRAGQRSVPAESMDAVRVQFSVPVAIEIDWDATDQMTHPMILIRATSPACGARLDLLSTRECEVARLIADGLTNKEIAARLGITTATVKDHVHRILERTGWRNRAAVAAAIATR